MSGARGVLINITGPSDMSLMEINDAVSMIQNEAHDDANIIFGAVIDEHMEDKVCVTVIATGFGREDRVREMMDDRTTPMRSVEQEPDERSSERPTARTVVPGDPREIQIPSFAKRTSREKRGRHLGVVDDYSFDSDEDLDIPTFLRKQAD